MTTVERESSTLIELNKLILTSPSTCLSNEEIKRLAIESPNLDFLCPLARAIYLIESDRIQELDAKEALLSCALIDYTYSGYPDSEDQAIVTEVVSHYIRKDFLGTEIELTFESIGEMTYYTGFWSEHLRTTWGTEWPLGQLDSPDQFITEIFRRLDKNAAYPHPSAYPTDNGDFLGSLSYELTEINGIQVHGPTYTYCNGEDDWESLSKQYKQRFPLTRSDHEGQMCWLHYLEPEQADRLGISRTNSGSDLPNKEYPAWLPSDIEPSILEATWISPDELQESYTKGTLQIPKSRTALLALGCGSEWSPDIEPEEGEEDDEEESASPFAPLNPPLMEIEINRDDDALPQELSILKPYLLLLGKLTKDGSC